MRTPPCHTPLLRRQAIRLLVVPPPENPFAPWLFLAPALLMFGVYVIAPIFESMALSLYDWDGLGTPEFIGLQNYVDLWDDPDFWMSLKNNLIWIFGFMLAVPAGLFLALFLNQTVFGIRLFKSLFFFPFVISQVVIGLVFSWFYDPSNGLLALVFTASASTPWPCCPTTPSSPTASWLPACTRRSPTA